MLIETMTFRLAAGVDEGEFVAADARLQTDFAYQQPGMVRRTTARGEGGEWVVIDFWESAADADACDARWDGDPVVAEWMAFVDAASVETRRYASLD